MSDGALKAGSVYVAVSASIGEFTKSMQSMIKSVEATAAKVKAAAESIGRVGLVFAAGIAGAVAEAAKANLSMRSQVDRLKALLYTLAGDMGDLFAPALKSLVKAVDGVVAAFQRMSPGMKTQLAHYAEWVAGAGLAAKAVGAGAGVVEGLAKAASLTLAPALKGASTAVKWLGEASKASLPSIGSLAEGLKDSAAGFLKSFGQMAVAAGSVLLPVLAVVAAVAALGLAAGAVYAAWGDTSTGLKDSVMSAVDALKGYAAKLAGFFRDVFEGLKNFFLAIVASVLDVLLAQVRAVAGALEKLAKGARQYDIADSLAQIQDLSGEKIVAALQDRMIQAGQVAGDALAKGVAFVGDVGRDAAKNVADSFSYSANGLKKLLGDTYKSSGLDKLVAQAEGLVKQLTGNGSAHATLRAEEPNLQFKEAGKGGGYEDLPESVRRLNEKGQSSVWLAYKDKLKNDAKAMADAMQSAKDSIKGRFMAAASAITSVVDNFKEGMASTGGNPLGGVAAVALDLLTKSKGFQEIMTMVSNVLQRVADALGSFLEPLEPLIGVVLNLVAIVATSLKPVLELVGKLLEPLVPVLVIIGDVLQVLTPLFQLLAGIIELLTLPIRLIAGVALKVLFEALKYLGAGLLAVARGIAWVWNGIVWTVQQVLKALAALPFLDALNKVADDMNNIKVDTNALADAQNKLLGTTWEMADAQGQATAAQQKNTAAMNTATEALTNVPAMWRKALGVRRVLDGQDPGSSGGSGSSWSVPTPPTPSAPAASTPAPAPVTNITITAHSTEETARALQKHADRSNYRGGRARYYDGPVGDP